ncbi:MAG: FIST C-terminal domain-containing protein [Chloroflexi bacterium]|nr:FIST C-terminal domain-containing protein [Chloroflexota bacterium]
MKWASAINDSSDLRGGLAYCAISVSKQLGADAPPSLVVVFASTSYGPLLQRVPAMLASRFPGSLIVGCSAGGVLAEGREIEDRPAVSLIAGHLPGTVIAPFRLSPTSLPTPDHPPDAWMQVVGTTPGSAPSLLLFVDPFSMDSEELLEGLDFAYPASVKVGGLASGGRGPGAHTLFLESGVYTDGAVGVALSGNITVDALVAQGCHPIGEPRSITRCYRNMLMEIDGETPVAYLRRLFPTLSPNEQVLMRQALFLGLATDPLADIDTASAGEFLIRRIIGAERDDGALTIRGDLQEGQIVRFYVRDAATSAQDLLGQLGRYRGVGHENPPKGVLLFQCNGRGAGLYGVPDHDSSLLRAALGPMPLAGFFCAGEIGPVGKATYLHTYTSSLAIFREKDAS